MITILQLLNEFLVLQKYKQDDEAWGVWDELRDEVQQNITEANLLMSYASDFKGEFKNFENLGASAIINAVNTRIYLGELLNELEEGEDE